MNKKGLTPLVATIVLVVFSLVIGIITMFMGKGYAEQLELEEKVVSKGTIVIDLNTIDTGLKELQIEHITGKISKEEYFRKEKAID